MNRHRLVLIVLAAVLVASACRATTDQGESVSCAGSSAEVTTHRYSENDGVAPELHSLDVHTSQTAAGCPILIWVHGGAWQLGDKQTRATTVKAEHFIAQGFVFVSVNYRLVSDDNAVRWPDFGNDVADAVSWVIDNAETIGGTAESVSLIGHSSGAHLVSIVAVNPDLLGRSGHDPSDLSCVISLDSVTNDLTDAPPWEVDIIGEAFPEPALLEDGSPTLQALANPPGPDGPSTLIVTRGRSERIESAQRLAEAIVAGGGAAEVADVSPYTHREVNVQLGEPGETVITPLVDQHLASCATQATD